MVSRSSLPKFSTSTPSRSARAPVVRLPLSMAVKPLSSSSGKKALEQLVVTMQGVVQDRGVLVGIERKVGADAGLKSEVAKDGGAGQERIEEAVAVALQLNAGRSPGR